MTNPIALLREAGKEIQALRAAEGLLAWDQETGMPAQGGGARAESLAAVSTLQHQKLTSEGFWKLIQEAGSQSGLSTRERAMVREFRRDAEKARKIPGDLAA